MNVDDKVILKLEKLARLNLSDEARQDLKHDLEEVLEMVKALEEVDTEGVSPLMHLIDTDTVLRKDQVVDQLTNEEALANAPKPSGPYFSVPQVIDRS